MLRHFAETDNIVNESQDGQGYENVTEYIKIGTPNISTLAKLDALEASETFGDREFPTLSSSPHTCWLAD